MRLLLSFYLLLFACLSEEAVRNCNQCVTNGPQGIGWNTRSRSCRVFNPRNKCVVKNVTDCPIPVRSGFAYDDSFARNIMFPLSAAAFSVDPQKCLTNVVNNTKLIRKITVPCEVGNECSGYTAVSDAHRAIIIAFRGTTNLLQLLTIFSAIGHDPQVSFPGGGKVGSYFYNALRSIWQAGMRDDVRRTIAVHHDYQIWITGYSLGGALAVLTSNFLATTKMAKRENIRVVTIGEPSVGDHDFAVIHGKLIPYSYRVVHAKDSVPHMRGKIKYYHRRYEVWYNNDMRLGDPYKICLSPNDCQCSNSVPAKQWMEMEHLDYFNKHVFDYGRNNCT